MHQNILIVARDFKDIKIGDIMLFWVLLDGFFFLAYFIGMYCLKQERDINIISVFLMIVLTFFTIIREGVWSDYYSYVELFYTDTSFLHQEPFFLLSIDILKAMGFSSQMMFLVYGIAVNTLFFRGIQHYFLKAKERLTAVLLFESLFCAWMFTINGLRQGMAMAIIFWGFQYLENKQIRKFILCIIIATLFHYSAIISLIMIFLYKKNISKIYLFLLIVISYVVGLQLDIANDIIVPILDFTADAIGIGSAYVRYAISDQWSVQGGSATAAMGMGALTTILLSLVVLLFIPMKDANTRFVANLIGIALCIRGVFWFSVPLMRLRYYFEMFLIIAVVLSTHRIAFEHRRVFTFGWVFLYILLHLLSIYIAGNTQNIDFGINLNFIE